MKIENVEVTGLNRVFKTAKYPMSTDIGVLNNNLTQGIEKCLTCPTGQGHDNALMGIVVQFDLTCTNKMWIEAERYHFLDIVCSQSSMHRIARFDIAQQCNEFVDRAIINRVNEIKAEYLANQTPENYLRLLYNIPSGFQLTAGVVTNYRQLKTIYQQRKDHRLKEWREFCKWIETLPYAELITGAKNDGTAM